MHEPLFTPDPFRDIPVAYAVYQVLMDEDRTRCVDTRYVYVNECYCTMAGKSQDELLGHSFMDSYVEADARWLDYCYQAVTTRKAVHDTIFAPEIDHWLDFTVSPLSEPDLVAYAFTNVDHQQKVNAAINRLRVTNDIVLRVSRRLNSGQDYRACMDGALAQLSTYVKPDRLYVLETDGITVSNTFEWCAEGIQPEIDTLQNRNYDEYIGGWEEFLKHDTSVVIPDIELLKEHDPIDYYNLKRQGIKRLLCSPFYSEGRIVGYLGADNYEVSDLVNTKAILESVSYFIGAKIANHNLVTQLEYLSRHDDLTGVGNRTALSQQVDLLSHMNGSVGIIFADVNGLKETNDEQGHCAGDEVLQFAANALSQIWGAANVYRDGGDEFIVLVPLIPRSDFDHGCEKLVRLIRDNGHHRLAIGTTWIDDAAHINEAITEADHRMYQDKAEYYNRHKQGRDAR